MWFLIMFVFFGEMAAQSVPPFIHPCKVMTPECLKAAIQAAIPDFVKGIPALGIVSLDPLNMDLDGYEPQPGIKIKLSNGRFTGLRKCVVDSASYANNEINACLHCNMTARGNYKATGQIIIVKVDGDGEAKVKGTNIILTAKLRFEDRIRNGLLYHVIKGYTVSHSYGDRVTFYATNLFKGNPEAGKAVLKFVNDNWAVVAKEFGSPLVNMIVQNIVKEVKKLFNAVPKKDLFP